MDNKYCIYCGTQNSREAKFCTKCGKEMDPTENLLIDFLVRRTKDKFKDETTTSVYEAVKNFLLSHLYGVMLTISFVSAIAVTSYASEPYIKEMSGDFLRTYNGSAGYNENAGTQGEYPAEHNMAVHNMITSYEFEVFNESLINSQGDIITTNPDRMRLPGSFGYGGVHELGTHIPTYIDGASMSGTTHRTEFDPALHQTDIAHQLTGDGYTVGECMVEAEFVRDSDGVVVASYEYLIVAVLVDGEWLVAEDRLLSLVYDDSIKYEENITPAVNIDDVAEIAMEYADNVFAGNDASYLLMSEDFGYSTEHQLAYDEAMNFDPNTVEKTLYYGVYTLADGFRNAASTVLMNDGYTVAEY